MASRESDLVAKYKGELTETSSVSDEEMKIMMAREGIPHDEHKDYETIGGKKVEVKRLVKGSMPPMPKSDDMERARKTPEYSEFIRVFEDKYGAGKPKQREVDEVTRKLDNKFKILSEHSKEIDRHDCDMMLYKNKVQKDLGDVMNDLREAYNIIIILMDDRQRLKDLFAIFNIQIKGLTALNKSLQEDLAMRDASIEKLKRALESAQNDLNRLKEQNGILRREKEEKVAENNSLKRQMNDQKGEIVKLTRQNDNFKDEIARLRKEVDRLKTVVKNKSEELDRVKAELPYLREESKRLNIRNNDLTTENEKLKADLEKMNERMGPVLEENKGLKADNKELNALNTNLRDSLKKLEDDHRNLMKEAKDLKPDNDKLTKQVEDLNGNVNDLLNECSNLRKRPQEMMDEYEPKLLELKETCNDLKEKNDHLMRENEALKRDLNEIMEERKKRNADRRKRKEEQMKKIVDDAHKKLEDSKRKMDEKRSMIEATDLVKSAVLTQDDLKKYPEQITSHPNPTMLDDDDIPEYNIQEVQVDKAMLDAPVEMFSRRPAGSKSSTQFFEVTEPYSFERAPYQTIALESDQLLSLEPTEELYDDPLFEADPHCPYGHSFAPPPAPVEEVKEFARKPPPKLSDADIRALIDKRLRKIFFMLRVPPNKLNATLQKDEDVKVLNSKYEEILDKCVPIIAPFVHKRPEGTSAEDAVNLGIDKNLEQIREMFRERKEIELKKPEVKDEEEIVTPSSALKMKLAGMAPKILQMIKSKQKEEVKEFRKVESGKVTWSKTHFIFAIDGSGSMRGRRAKAVEQGFERCVSILKNMKEIVISSFTFDDKCTDHIQMLDPISALKKKGRMPLTYGENTSYVNALGKAINIIEADTAHPDYLLCIIFMSDGKGGYPESQVETLIKMKESGRKMMLITLACETEEDEDLMKMANAMKGEHYKVTDADAMKSAFMRIISSQQA